MPVELTTEEQQLLGTNVTLPDGRQGQVWSLAFQPHHVHVVVPGVYQNELVENVPIASLGTRRMRPVLNDVAAERVQQISRYGHNADLLDGTGPDVEWIPFYPADAALIEREFRADYDAQPINWMRLVREEVAEAFKESNPERLRAELIQVAALCVSWVEKLDERP